MKHTGWDYTLVFSIDRLQACLVANSAVIPLKQHTAWNHCSVFSVNRLIACLIATLVPLCGI